MTTFMNGRAVKKGTVINILQKTLNKEIAQFSGPLFSEIFLPTMHFLHFYST